MVHALPSQMNLGAGKYGSPGSWKSSERRVEVPVGGPRKHGCGSSHRRLPVRNPVVAAGKVETEPRRGRRSPWADLVEASDSDGVTRPEPSRCRQAVDFRPQDTAEFYCSRRVFGIPSIKIHDSEDRGIGPA